MEDNLPLVYFTPESGDIADIAHKVTLTLDSGLFIYAHLRQPLATRDEMRRLIESIPQRLRSRLTLHDHFDLAEAYGLGGVHLNSRNTRVPKGWHGRVSRSCHSLDEAVSEIGSVAHYDYVTLSPVFPSISKQGYSSGLASLDIPVPGIVALGGVTARRLPEVRRRGYSGAALLGWLDVELPEFNARLRQLRMFAGGGFALQYITNGVSPGEVEQEVLAVLRGGCRWVQIRMKDAPDSVVEQAAMRVVPLCRAVGAVCLLDDRVHLAGRVLASGVHLGKNDMSPAEARKLLGENAIIGSTANTLADIEAVTSLGASDYIGLGPYRFTLTKRRLSPVLGLEGYSEIMADEAARRLPVVAIGGIECRDVPRLMAAGVDGVAVSGAIYLAANRKKATENFLKSLHKNIL